MPVRSSISSALVLAGLVVASSAVGCSAGPYAADEDVGDDEAEVVSDDAKAVFGELAFLDRVVASEEATGAPKASALAALAAAMPERVEAWAGAATREEHVVALRLDDGRTATLTTRTFADASAPGRLASMTRVALPDGRSLVYGERIRVVPRITAELFKVDGSRLVPVLRKHGDASTEPGALVAQALPALEAELRPQAGMSRPARARFCGACTMTLMAARFLGPALLGFAGTSSATAACAKVGLAAATAASPTGPGAAVAGGGGWLACNVVFFAVGSLVTSAVLLESDQDRMEACSTAFDKVWLGRVCDGTEPEVCTLGAIAKAPTAQAKCVKMGQCARAFNCQHDANALCPSLVTSGASREVCDKVVTRTCQRPLGLFEDADFAASCEAIAGESSPAPQEPPVADGGAPNP